MPDHKTMQTRCPGGFSVMWVPKLLLTPIFGQILAFLAHLVPRPTKKRCKQGAYVVFLLSGYQNFYSLPPKIRFRAQKRPNLAQNWHFWPNIGIFGPFDPMPDQKTIQTSCLGTMTKILSPSICYIVAILRFVVIYTFLLSFKCKRVFFCPD